MSVSNKVAIEARKLCRQRGWRYDTLERYDARAGVRRDAFGWVDIMAYDGIYWRKIQVCRKADKAAHVQKLIKNPCRAAINDWLMSIDHIAMLWVYAPTRQGGWTLDEEIKIDHQWLLDNTPLLRGSKMPDPACIDRRDIGRAAVVGSGISQETTI